MAGACARVCSVSWSLVYSYRWQRGSSSQPNTEIWGCSRHRIHWWKNTVWSNGSAFLMQQMNMNMNPWPQPALYQGCKMVEVVEKCEECSMTKWVKSHPFDKVFNLKTEIKMSTAEYKDSWQSQHSISSFVFTIEGVAWETCGWVCACCKKVPHFLDHLY